MRGQGVFSTLVPEFADFLSQEGGASGKPETFPARNFLLDEGVPPERGESYRDAGGAAGHGSRREWVAAHEGYLENRVFPKSTDGRRPDPVDSGDRDACPETFRFIQWSSPFAESHGDLHLLRVQEIRSVAKETQRSPDEIESLAQQVVDSGGDDTVAAEKLDDILVEWTALCDSRPVFAGFWQDLDGLFGEPLDQAWPNRVRDRLGLAHLNPTDRGGHIGILVFRYAVADVPTLRGQRDVRPLVPPTVLDGRHSQAFCPAPRDSLTGHTVDLGADSLALCREVLHPAIEFRAKHVWRVGRITEPVTDDQISQAREWHIECVRDKAKRPDYATGTDQRLPRSTWT